MTHKSIITGPTFEEMLHPETIAPATRAAALRMKTEDPLDPINLFNITWKDAANTPYYQVLPTALTGVDANIVVLYGKEFPTGAHKVGAAYSVLVEKELFGEVDPSQHTLVWPSTGNYGIGGAWVGCRMGFDGIVVLPAEMSQERFERIRSYGARVIATPGSESNVKEIYDKTWELRRDPKVRVLNQFEVMGNYRFHYYVTGNTIVELAALLHSQGIGNGKIAAYCSAMGSAGTIAAGDRLKQVWPDHRIIGLEPVQCPTMYNNGYGSHDIQGIGDKHVTWIHNVNNMDAIMCLDDIECKKGLQLLTEPAGWETLQRRYGIAPETVQNLAAIFGISGVCNVLASIREALAQLPAQHSVIHLNPEDAELIRMQHGDTLARAGHRIHENPQLSRGDVLVEAGGTQGGGLTAPARLRWFSAAAPRGRAPPPAGAACVGSARWPAISNNARFTSPACRPARLPAA